MEASPKLIGASPVPPALPPAPAAGPGPGPGPGAAPAPGGAPPLPVQPPMVADAEQKQRNLDRMKRRATGLLVVMTGIFVVTRLLERRYPWLGYVRATAEAAMVG